MIFLNDDGWALRPLCPEGQVIMVLVNKQTNLHASTLIYSIYVLTANFL